MRDLASVHGTYKRVQETRDAINLIGKTIQELQVSKTTWLLDRPVSNSGRLRELLLEIAAEQGWSWEVDLFQNPDIELKKIGGTVVTTDSNILDSVGEWFHLNQQVLLNHVPNAHLIELRC